MAALLFLGVAYFAVAQATVLRNNTQTAADAAALAAARANRDELAAAFLVALQGGDLVQLGHLLAEGGLDDGEPCAAADAYAGDNDAEVTSCDRVDGPTGYTVGVISKGTVGSSVVDGTETKKAKATATAVVEPRCALDDKDGTAIHFTCHGDVLSVDPTAGDFRLDLSTFYSVHLSK